jgi:hypothetical protein
VRLGRGKKVSVTPYVEARKRQGTKAPQALLGRLPDEVGRLLIKPFMQVMRLFRSWRFPRVAALLAIVILLCVGTFLPLFPTGHEVPAALMTARSSHVDQGTNGYWHPLDANYPVVSAEEAQEVDKHPGNAYLLTALLLLALSFWAIVVWVLTNVQGQWVFRSLGIDRRRWLPSALEERPFLGVFRL